MKLITQAFPSVGEVCQLCQRLRTKKNLDCLFVYLFQFLHRLSSLCVVLLLEMDARSQESF